MVELAVVIDYDNESWTKKHQSMNRTIVVKGQPVQNMYGFIHKNVYGLLNCFIWLWKVYSNIW